jgi:DnaJ-class molecular chaperone
MTPQHVDCFIRVNCPACDGEGLIHHAPPRLPSQELCVRCSGKGRVRVPVDQIRKESVHDFNRAAHHVA